MLKRLFLSERIVLIAIILNAAVIFTLSFKHLANHTQLLTFDHFFTIFFLLEAIVKIFHFGWKGYFQSNWNKFDFFIVLVSLPALCTFWLDLPDISSILILRLLRLARLMRFVKFIPEMQQLLVGLGRALKASLLVLMALLIYNFIVAIFTCNFYQDIAPEYFGNPVISCYTIFQMFTLEGWNTIPETIAERAGNNSMAANLARLYFVLVVLSGGLFGLSLANAIFVDEMTMDNNIVLEEKIDHLNEKIDRLEKLLGERLEW